MEHEQEMNTRLYKRNIPDQARKPKFDFRPQPTKYSDYNISTGLPNLSGPGTIDEFVHKIDLESHLRNQFMALQRAPQAYYVPKLKSSLYHNPMSYEKSYSTFVPSPNYKAPMCQHLEPHTFHNSTRYYLKKET